MTRVAFMKIPNNFLEIMFTEITLLHILLILGIPYLIVYVFEKYTKFDKFWEKWEGGLFIFSIGGLITFFSILLQEAYGFPLKVSYVYFLIITIILLFIIGLTFNKKKLGKSQVGWVKVKMKNGDIYTGVYMSKNNLGLHLGSDKNNKILKESNNKKNEIKAKNIFFNWREVFSIFYY
jgi:hypothetical protein